MDLSKKAAFNQKMGKAKHFPRHQNLSKGGMVDKRKHFDDGGIASNTTTAGGQGGNSPDQALGSAVTGLGTALTTQNQYQAQLAPTTQLNYTNPATYGFSNASNPTAVNSAISAEQGLAGQYQNIANGTGANPAIAALNQQTGTNVANTAALQAGQRGGSQNAGLLARQIGQQGAATQQQAVGQAATNESTQQLNALAANANLQNQIASQGLGEQGVGSNLYATAVGGNNAQNNTNVSNYAQAQGLNQATTQANTNAVNNTTGGILNGFGALASLNQGGEVEKMDAGGGVSAPPLTTPSSVLSSEANTINPNDPNIATGQSAGAPQSFIASNTNKSQTPQNSFSKSSGGGGGGLGSLLDLFSDGGKVCEGEHQSHLANYFAKGGEVPALVSAREVYLNPHQVEEVIARGADPMKIGHHFPGKDKVHKNSEKNDVIPVTLEDGGVIVPISITTHKDASDKARNFVLKAHTRRYLKKPQKRENNA